MQSPKTFKYTDQWGEEMDVILLRRQYMDGSLAVQMLCKADGYWDFWGDVTVNLCDATNQNASFAYVDTNNMPAVADFLSQNGLAIYTGMTRASGFCAYPLYAFTSEFFETCANEVEEVR
ncbi:MAG: DUF4313 domain-containing protein [Coriobacteriales bacterium]|nr:DUF4313 domain-containing protein [Coriobacteriales bacterium]